MSHSRLSDTIQAEIDKSAGGSHLDLLFSALDYCKTAEQLAGVADPHKLDIDKFRSDSDKFRKQYAKYIALPPETKRENITGLCKQVIEAHETLEKQYSIVLVPEKAAAKVANIGMFAESKKPKEAKKKVDLFSKNVQPEEKEKIDHFLIEMLRIRNDDIIDKIPVKTGQLKYIKNYMKEYGPWVEEYPNEMITHELEKVLSKKEFRQLLLIDSVLALKEDITAKKISAAKKYFDTYSKKDVWKAFGSGTKNYAAELIAYAENRFLRKSDRFTQEEVAEVASHRSKKLK